MNLSRTTLCLFLLVTTLAVPEEDRITSLKGYYDFTQEFEMFSGYLELQQTPRIAAHYVFITSKSAPQTDDLVLWLNGGPGCTSMYGFLQEFGPHVINQGADSLAPSPNPFAWNRKANILYIESPPGVGFSINDDPAYQYSDSQTADDNLQSLRLWFQKFPEYQTNPFWISGESYAGIYIPELAHLIVLNQDTLIEGGKVNFQGLFIGNAALNVDGYWRTKVTMKFFESHYYFGPEILQLTKNCKYTAEDDNNPSCQIGLQLADNAVSRINAYNPIGICYNIQPFPFATLNTQSTKTNQTRRRPYSYTMFYKGIVSLDNDEPDCDTDDSGLIKYLNDPEVQAQLHVRPTKWTPCNGEIYYKYQKGGATVPLFKTFKTAGLKMMLFSGNVDAVVPYYQTEEYLKQIGWPVVKEKRPVLNPRGSLEGWVTIYDNNLAYYVINAGGHMVPNEKPDATLKMFESFISGSIWQ